jgi:N6-L-threonylcarbamoyladenine synthase
MEKLTCLGIESTAHTFGISILKDDKFLANELHSYTNPNGGIHPTEAALHHKAQKDNLLNSALKKANLTIKEIDLISVSNAPGLPPCLLVGLNFAKELAEKHKIPVVSVNHCIAHLEIGKLVTNAKDPVLLYASGANTQIIAYESGKYRIFGETLDTGLGNFLDAFARSLGIGFPGGPKIQELAESSNNYIEIPYVVKGMDVSFSGLLTNLKQKLRGSKKEDLAFSAQETAFAMLIEVSERAMAHCNKNELLLGGGVCCNKRLQEMAKIMCKERNASCFIPENQYLIDNAAMIAYTGLLKYKAQGPDSLKELDINPYQRTDQIEVTWK